MVRRPPGVGAFEFTALAALRAAQLQRGCEPRVAPAAKLAITAQQEVADGKVARVAVPSQPTEAPPE